MRVRSAPRLVSSHVLYLSICAGPYLPNLSIYTYAFMLAFTVLCSFSRILIPVVRFVPFCPYLLVLCVDLIVSQLAFLIVLLRSFLPIRWLSLVMCVVCVP